MSRLFIVNNPKRWPLKIPGVDVVAARTYLGDTRYSEMRGAKIFNLCRSYRYQSVGYYVSLLAEARGHRPIPSVITLQDLRMQSIVRVASEDLEELIQQSLAHLESSEFTLSIYFGQNIAKRYNRLSKKLFTLFEAPMLQARFTRMKNGWQLQQIEPIAVNEVPGSHREFLITAAQDYFRTGPARRKKQMRYDLAILHEPDAQEAPSDNRALRRFARAAESLGMAAELITREDYNRIAEFDALFIRATTSVNHYTYRFSRRAAAEGLAVIDDPDSIVRCTNKVYLAEVLQRYKVPIPKTVIVHRENNAQLAEELTFPCVLKRPDSSFSRGVIRIDTRADFLTACEDMLAKSDLLIAQEFIPTEFDWRVGVLEGNPLYVCKYHMAWKHWQIIKEDSRGRLHAGQVETFAVHDAPAEVIRTALKAARLMGDGLYGVDVKQVGRRPFIMEVNDNPSIDAGYEDRVLGDRLYQIIMRTLLRRIEILKEK
jgi:glutathione synthase/RimK-type ligase-like ATP-grasp enzyme